MSVAELALMLRCDESELQQLEAGQEPHVGVALMAVKWLGADLDDFLVEQVAGEAVDPSTRAQSVAAFLRSDRELKPESAEAIEAVLNAAYARFSAA
jgi:transcriptional regulator with XRE-family HTH domain